MNYFFKTLYSPVQAAAVLEEMEDPNRRQTAFRGPDIFVVLNVDGSYRRQKWVVWEEGGHYPDVIIELLSPSTRKVDLGIKKDLYESTFGTAEYFCFDYLNPEARDSLIGWRLERGRYQPIAPDARGWLWSEMLGLWVGRWRGTIARDEAVWVRFYTLEGALVLTPAEAAKARAAEQTQARRAEARARRAAKARAAEQTQARRAEARARRAAEARAAEQAQAHRAEARARRAAEARAAEQAQARRAAEAEVIRLQALLAQQST